ncbi:Eaf7p NDAI_0F02980 [Naumovozyma dairenensis CBS 421]|uniref:Chromatin modification-related protein EAF7 n=1 Tax=Naumovozyma dairenensis (strain ATCC 10597 / BCRC 20456 / CBS 421 / NBRC 0211 / NRRL Y-12639) TaxID=1071378 RepID=G0WCV5_NAUDC|nr:hypothetical protein NDAI_0F02980 [Naumovozyma dairenensis CBS 421]CCD25616.1 hypothetical protein NDAI_0F02980 [Naumovozyma dairenensis CBS 421]
MAIDWTIVDEIRLFRWVAQFKPAGIHKHFHMLCIVERMNHPDKYPMILLQKEVVKPGKIFTAKDIWDRLNRYYDFDEADKLENEVPAMEDDTTKDNITKHDNNHADQENKIPKDENNNNNHNSNIEEEYDFDDSYQEEEMTLLKLKYKLLTQKRDFALPWAEYGELILSNAKNGAPSEEEEESKDVKQKDIEENKVDMKQETKKIEKELETVGKPEPSSEELTPSQTEGTNIEIKSTSSNESPSNSLGVSKQDTKRTGPRIRKSVRIKPSHPSVPVENHNNVKDTTALKNEVEVKAGSESKLEAKSEAHTHAEKNEILPHITLDETDAVNNPVNANVELEIDKKELELVSNEQKLTIEEKQAAEVHDAAEEPKLITKDKEELKEERETNVEKVAKETPIEGESTQASETTGKEANEATGKETRETETEAEDTGGTPKQPREHSKEEEEKKGTIEEPLKEHEKEMVNTEVTDEFKTGVDKERKETPDLEKSIEPTPVNENGTGEGVSSPKEEPKSDAKATLPEAEVKKKEHNKEAQDEKDGQEEAKVEEKRPKKRGRRSSILQDEEPIGKRTRRSSSHTDLSTTTSSPPKKRKRKPVPEPATRRVSSRLRNKK